MERVARYFASGWNDQNTLNTNPAYVLTRIKGEALALHAARPENRWLNDQACVVIGYVEAFSFYRDGEFPWGHVVERLNRMRSIIAEAEFLAWRVNHGSIGPIRRTRSVVRAVKIPKPKKSEDRGIRYEGRWVSRKWYARYVKQAA